LPDVRCRRPAPPAGDRDRTGHARALRDGLRQRRPAGPAGCAARAPRDPELQRRRRRRHVLQGLRHRL
nr:hypothetical protein [Tanacetum cinerariifolium]